jgi:hypothetical protein
VLDVGRFREHEHVRVPVHFMARKLCNEELDRCGRRASGRSDGDEDRCG